MCLSRLAALGAKDSYKLAVQVAKTTEFSGTIQRRNAAFVDYFSGRLIGKSEKKESLGSSVYRRVVGKRTAEVKVLKSDPMRFENMVLATGEGAAFEALSDE